MKKSIISLIAVLGISTACYANADQKTTPTSTPENMTCQEFIDLNPQAMTPVAFWLLNNDTVFKQGDYVALQESTIAETPKILAFCKTQPTKKLAEYKK